MCVFSVCECCEMELWLLWSTDDFKLWFFTILYDNTPNKEGRFGLIFHPEGIFQSKKAFVPTSMKSMHRGLCTCPTPHKCTCTVIMTLRKLKTVIPSLQPPVFFGRRYSLGISCEYTCLTYLCLISVISPLYSTTHLCISSLV